MSILNLNTKPEPVSRISVDMNTVEALRLIADQFAGRALLETNFSPEDQVLTHLIFQYDIPIRVFTRSGRHEYEILKETVDRYGKAIEVSFLQAELATQTFADNNREQIAAWENKPAIAPLSYVLQHKHVLLSSLRNERVAAAPLTWDDVQEKFVFSPLIYWTNNQIYAYILENDIPHVAESIPVLTQTDTLADAVHHWSISFRKYLPKYSVVSGSFNLVHQVATFFRLPPVMHLSGS
jgi:phosphoadenosine phosphosulfate reductase